MTRLEYYDGTMWVLVSEWTSAYAAWVSLGADTYGYRTVGVDGKIIAQDI